MRINSYLDWATSLRLQLILSVGLLSAQTARGDGCDATLMHTYSRARLYVSALHLDKPGQVRVAASDGAVYTAGEVFWLKGQLRGVAKACSAGHSEIAATRLSDIESTLQSHQARLAD